MFSLLCIIQSQSWKSKDGYAILPSVYLFLPHSGHFHVITSSLEIPPWHPYLHTSTSNFWQPLPDIQEIREIVWKMAWLGFRKSKCHTINGAQLVWATMNSRNSGGELKRQVEILWLHQWCSKHFWLLSWHQHHCSFDSDMGEDAGLDYYAFRLCSVPARCPAFVMQMGGTKCLFDNVQSEDKNAFTATVKLIHKAGRQ